uniref:Preprochensinin-2CE n=1 Tax=Rana chensinensis TaxID=79015 RepID=F1AEL6_9NEOB|nr:preprochensinin-2CE [Rana chensinensis]
MFTMKKSMLLLFFLGTISLSLCEQEREADEDENGVKVTKKEAKINFAEIFAAVNKLIKQGVVKG